MNAFEHAAANARPDCPRCKGTGSYMYDHNHGTVCNLCCKHDAGFWQLIESYGENNGRWCCLAGCGMSIGFDPENFSTSDKFSEEYLGRVADKVMELYPGVACGFGVNCLHVYSQALTSWDYVQLHGRYETTLLDVPLHWHHVGIVEAP